MKTTVLVLLFLAAAAYAQSEAPVVSPDGRRIAFTSARDGMADLYIIAADGGGEVRLTHTPEVEGRPDWSADGKRVIFSVSGQDESHIYSVGADGSNLREIGKVPGRTPRVSPDGKRVVFARGSWTEMQLRVANLDGSDSRLLNDGKAIAWGPQWSRDGKRIAYGSRMDQHLNIWTVRADGSEARQLTHVTPEIGEAQMPAWSRDGRRIAFQVDRGDTKSVRLWIADARSGEAHPLGAGAGPVKDGSQDEVPYWFPNGKRLAFQSNRSGRMEIWTVNADGSGARQVTGAP
jgi:TolB protein